MDAAEDEFRRSAWRCLECQGGGRRRVEEDWVQLLRCGHFVAQSSGCKFDEEYDEEYKKASGEVVR